LAIRERSRLIFQLFQRGHQTPSRKKPLRRTKLLPTDLMVIKIHFTLIQKCQRWVASKYQSFTVSASMELQPRLFTRNSIRKIHSSLRRLMQGSLGTSSQVRPLLSKCGRKVTLLSFRPSVKRETQLYLRVCASKKKPVEIFV